MFYNSFRTTTMTMNLVIRRRNPRRAKNARPKVKRNRKAKRRRNERRTNPKRNQRSKLPIPMNTPASVAARRRIVGARRRLRSPLGISRRLKTSPAPMRQRLSKFASSLASPTSTSSSPTVIIRAWRPTRCSPSSSGRFCRRRIQKPQAARS